jgi:hypothetical protein
MNQDSVGNTEEFSFIIFDFTTTGMYGGESSSPMPVVYYCTDELVIHTVTERERERETFSGSILLNHKSPSSLNTLGMAD